MFIFEICSEKILRITRIKRLPYLYQFRKGFYSIDPDSLIPHIDGRYPAIVLLFEGRTKTYRSHDDNKSYNRLYRDIDMMEMTKKKKDISFEWIRTLRSVLGTVATYFGMIIILIVLAYVFLGGYI